MEGRLIIVSAPSGSGKTTIVRRLMKAGLNLEFSVSATSRPPRKDESDGRDYYFVSADDFRKKISNGELLEWQEVYPDQFYGTLRSEVERIWNNGHHVLFDLDVMGGMNMKNMFPDISLSVFIMPPSIQILEKRLRLRSTEDKESLKKRIEKAGYEMTFSGRFDRIVVNDDLETAVNEAIQSVKHFLET